VGCCGQKYTRIKDITTAKFVRLTNGRKYYFHVDDVESVEQIGGQLIVFLNQKKFTYLLSDIEETNLF